MKRTITSLLFIILSIMATAGVAFEMPKECLIAKKQASIGDDCVSCAEGFAISSETPGKRKLGSDFSRVMKEITFFDQKVEALSNVTSATKRNLVPLFRTLRDGITEPSYKRSMLEINAIKEDFDRLTELSRESALNRIRFDKMLFSNRPLRRLELEDELVEIQKAKAALLIKHPILNHPLIEEKLSELPESMIQEGGHFSQKDYESLLFKVLVDNLKDIGKLEDEINRFKYDSSKPLTHVRDTPFAAKYLNRLVDEFPILVGEVVASASYDGTFRLREDTELLCMYAEKYKSYAQMKKIQAFGVNAAVVIVPLALGPEGAAIGRLLLWGLRGKSAVNTIKASAAIAQFALVGRDISDLKTLSDKCDRDKIRFYTYGTEDAFKTHASCKKELGEEIFITQMGVFVGGASGLAHLAAQTIKLHKAKKLADSLTKEVTDSEDILQHLGDLKNLRPGQVGLEFVTPDQGTFSILNLKDVIKSGNDDVKKIPLEYWKYVGGIYKERLNLTAKEVDDFIQSSIDMSSRTKLIVNTEKSPLSKEAMKIKGGVGVVDSHKSSELLPVEKATGIRIMRRPNEKIVELVRLTVGKGADATKLSGSLIDQALSVALHDKDVSRVFVFTSKIHGRLYKSMGVPPTCIRPVDGRDVIIELSRSELDKIIQHRANVRAGKISGRSMEVSEAAKAI